MLVPKILRNEMKRLLHSGHLEIVKTINRAKEIIYWPRIYNDITNIVNACELCLEHRNKQNKNLLHHTTCQKLRGQKIVAMDNFHPGRKPYLAIVDYTTGFFDIIQLPGKLSSMVVIHAKHLFSKYGIPRVVISDNGAEFRANTFKNFSKQWDFKHTTSSPQYPKSNGQIEGTNQK